MRYDIWYDHHSIYRWINYDYLNKLLRVDINIPRVRETNHFDHKRVKVKTIPVKHVNQTKESKVAGQRNLQQETKQDTHRVCCPCQHTERGGRLGVELSAPERRSWPAGAGGWGTGPGPAAPGPAARLERLSSWLCWSRTGAGQRRWRPAGAWRCCCRSVGTCGAAPPGPPLCKVLWRQRRSSLQASGEQWHRPQGSDMQHAFCFLLFFYKCNRRLKSLKSYRHIFLQAHRQIPQTVWDSSPVYEFLKCAFWPKDIEKVNTSVKQHRFNKSCIKTWHQLRVNYAQQSSLNTLEKKQGFHFIPLPSPDTTLRRNRGESCLFPGSRGNRLQHLSSCNSPPFMRQNSVPTSSRNSVKTVSCWCSMLQPDSSLKPTSTVQKNNCATSSFD